MVKNLRQARAAADDPILPPRGVHGADPGISTFTPGCGKKLFTTFGTVALWCQTASIGAHLKCAKKLRLATSNLWLLHLHGAVAMAEEAHAPALLPEGASRGVLELIWMQHWAHSVK